MQFKMFPELPLFVDPELFDGMQSEIKPQLGLAVLHAWITDLEFESALTSMYR